jgi:multicomponent Na+:H+ antiporter subunit F
MRELFVGAALFLLLTFLAGMIRVLIGPGRTDRMLAAQLFGTTGVAMMLLLAEGLGQPPLRDVALVFAILAGVAAVAFVRGATARGQHDRVDD